MDALRQVGKGTVPYPCPASWLGAGQTYCMLLAKGSLDRAALVVAATVGIATPRSLSCFWYQLLDATAALTCPPEKRNKGQLWCAMVGARS